jgi:hypothetical protein
MKPLLLGLFSAILFCGCSSPAPTVDVAAVQTQSALAIFGTQTASVPTSTKSPTHTDAPRTTSTPSATRTPDASKTPLPPTLSADDAIRLLDWNWYRSEGGDFVYVDGELQNATSEPMEFVELSIKLMDSNKKLLATQRGFIDAQLLESGATSTFKIIASNRPGTEIVGISNIQWRWAGKGTPQALDLPTLTPITPTETSTPRPTPIVVGVGQRLSANGFGWKVTRAEFVKTLTNKDGNDGRTARGIYLVVLLDLDWANPAPLHNFQSLVEFHVTDQAGNRYMFEGSPQSAYAQTKYLPADHLVAEYSRDWEPKPYSPGEVLHDAIVYDVPDDNSPIYLRDDGYPRLIIRLR